VGMKKTVYLDSTIPSFYFEERSEFKYQREITIKWFIEESQYFDIYISEETIAELSQGNYPNKKIILDFIKEFTVLQHVSDIDNVANVYIQNFLMPNDVFGDAIHLAYASFYHIDFLLTWNCNHLANANKKKHINIINTRMELSIPELITPLELFTEK
jgi:hypothetical protein